MSVSRRTKTRLSRFAALVAALALVSSGAVALEIAAPVPAQASVGSNDYPATWQAATDCSGTYGIYSWCIGTGPNADISPLGFGYRNCTDYAAYEINEQMGGTVSNPQFSYSAFGFTDGDAAGWKSAVISQLGSSAVDGTPAVGSVAWYGSEVADGFGHVAIVDSIAYNGNGSVSSITVSDYNHLGTGNYDSYTINSGSGNWPDDFLHIADVSSGGGGGGSLVITHQPYALVMPDGSLNLMAIGAYGDYWLKTWSSGNGWSGWGDKGTGNGGGGFIDSPFALVMPDGSLNLMAISNDGDFWLKTWSSGSGWSGWGDKGTGNGTTFTGSPYALVMPDGSLNLFAIGANGHMWLKTWSSGGGWSGWGDQGTANGTTFTGSPFALVMPDGSLNVLANSANGHMWLKTWSSGSGWSSWGDKGTGNGTTFKGSPDALVMPDGSLNLFALGNDGNYWLRSWSSGGGWSSWGNKGTGNGTTFKNTPDALVMPDGSLNLFALGNDGNYWLRSWSSGGGWSSWGNKGTGSLFKGSPDALVMPDGSLNLMAIGTDGNYWQDVWSSGNGWSGWGSQGTGNGGGGY